MTLNPVFAGYCVDRTEETERFLGELTTATTPQVIIIFSGTGVGKSALSSRFLSELDLAHNYLPVRVRTPPENSAANPESGLYVQKMFVGLQDSIGYYARNKSQAAKTIKRLTFGRYVANQKDPSLRRELFHELIGEVVNVKNAIAFAVLSGVYGIKWLFRLGPFDFNSILNETSIRSRSIIDNYMKYVFKRIRIVMSIENAQNIDATSLSCLVDWINESGENPSFLILEYTLSENLQGEDMVRMSERFKEANVAPRFRRLEKLRSADALSVLRNEILRSDAEISDELAVEYYHKSADGNIRKLIDFGILSTPTRRVEDNSTLENIRQLANDEKFILALLVACNGNIPNGMFNAILVTCSDLVTDAPASLSALEDQRHLIERDNQSWSVRHASIIDAWKTGDNEFQRFNLLAYSRIDAVFRPYVRQPRQTTQERSKAFFTLIQLYRHYSPERLGEMLDELFALVIEAISPQKAWEYVEQLINQTNDHILQQRAMYFRILEMCYRYELFLEGLACVEMMERAGLASDQKLIVYKAMFLGMLDRNDECVAYASKKIIENSSNTRLVFNLQLAKLICFRAVNDSENLGTIQAEIDRNSAYSKFDEYGYYLRLKELNEPVVNGLSDLKESIAFFDRRKLPVQAAKSKLALAYNLAATGLLKEGCSTLRGAEDVLSTYREGRHYFANNLAAIDLLSETFDEGVWRRLDLAEMIAVVPFDHVAIGNNKLIWCKENGDKDRANYVINKLLRNLADVPDRHLQAVSMYNLYVYYDSIGSEEAGRYFQRTYDLRLHSRSVRARVERRDTEYETEFMLSKPWHVCFLAYWNFDVLY